MSAKWRALQHRHRYTYSSVSFPQSYIEQLERFPDTKFYAGLKELARLNSTYAQVEHAKRVATAFTGILSSGDISILLDAAQLYLEIMFFENSLPLHRTLVSALVKARDHQSLIGVSFKSLCEEYGRGCNKKGKRFLVSRAALSIMGMPKLGYLIDVVEGCAVLVAWDVVNGLNEVFSESDSTTRPSPIVMEQYQEALSCLYYLLQKFPSKFKDLIEESIMGPILDVVLRILRTMYFSRDCFVASGVTVCAALQVCLSPEELGLFIIKGMFGQSTYICSGSSESQYMRAIAKLQYEGNLLQDILNLSVLSRLCLIRGILTAVSRNVLNMPFTFATDELDKRDGFAISKITIKTVLYDGILPELCNYCENPTDSHFNFHSLTVLQICLQQIKTSMLSDLTILSDEYCPIGEEMGTRILRIIWNNLEDPLSQTVKQVHLIFDLFLDIQSTLNLGEGGDKIKPFLEKIALDLLHLGSQCKGRYVPLALLTKRLGAKAMLSMSQGLLYETIYAYIDDDVCCALTSFLKCFLESLRDEFWNSDGVENGYLLYRECCLPPLVNGLASGVSKLRSNINTYALSVILEIDVDSIFHLLGFVLEESGLENVSLKDMSSTTIVALQTEQKVAVLVSLLKVSRMLALIEGDIYCPKDHVVLPNGDFHSQCNKIKFAVLLIKGIQVKIPIEWLEVALTHVDESLRVDAAEFLFLNPKTSSLPSHLELTLMKETIPLNMRSPSTAFQMKWGGLFRKFFSRVRTSLEKQFKQHSWTPLLSLDRVQDVDTETCRADNLFRFMRWLGCFLFFSCYPSAPYRRKIMATELIKIMIDAWPISPSDTVLCPYSEGITSADSTYVLVGSIVDSWDKLRDSSFSILLHFPTPLPGFCSEERVVDVIKWAKLLVCSPRVRESDAGALTLRLIFRKYVLDLGWIVGASVKVICQSHSGPKNRICQKDQQKYPVISYLRSLIDWLEVSVVEGEKDLTGACRNSFVHGVLLALRYTFEELDWNCDVPRCCMMEMRSALEKLLNLVLRVTSLALWVVSADAWFLPEDMDEMIDDDNFVLEDVLEETNNVHVPDINSKGGGRDSKSSDQIVMVGCWLAMKEVSLLLGTIVRKIPLPSNTYAGLGISDSPTSGDAVIDLQQLKTMGDNFLEVLLKMKHNGAIDKTRAGFSALCNRLLCSDDPRLCKLPQSWMEQLMQRTSAKGQLVDDLLRRSAGIPAAFIALFLSEPVGSPKKLLPLALRWLIDVANTTLQDLNTTTISHGDSSFTKMKQDEESSKISKVRDEGVVPTVHAFNVLRTAFNDTNLSADTSGFSAEALIASIRAFSSPYWEVRNSACLAYTALVRRMVGFLNVQKRDSARRALTGLEFFHRYPLLHSFLFKELEVATEFLADGHSGKSNYREKAVHPSLCPVLIFLSRLKPSSLASEIGDDLDPFLFMPFIRKCSTHYNMRVRILASRALTGLVSNEKLPSVLTNIATELSYSNGTVHPPFNLIHGILLQLGNLLDINCRNLSDSAKKDQILVDLIKVLARCPWIGNPRLCPCPVLNTSFVKVLHHMLTIAWTCHTESIVAIRNLLLELTTQCLELDASCGLPFYDPTTAELREQASTSYLSCFVRVGDEGISSSDLLLETLIRILSDSAYEARLAALKWLLKFLTTMEPNNGGLIAKWAKTNLQGKLMGLLGSEEHHKCKCYILRIFFKWNSMQFKRPGRDSVVFVGSMDCKSLLQVWDTLISVYNSSRHIKTREILICCLGGLVKPFVETLTNFVLDDTKPREMWDRLYSCVCFTCDIIKQHSSSSEQGNMRKAAAESMIASGLLEQAELIGPFVSSNDRRPSDESSILEPNESVNSYARRVLSMWFTCIRLLEDEDDEIRNKLGLDLQKCFSTGKWNDGVVSSQVDKVIEMSFDHLSTVFGHWVHYFDWLARCVFDISNGDVFTEENLVKRVFDKEIDNHHEEKLLICQLCCFHMEKLSKSSSWISDGSIFADYLYDWRLRFRNQLGLFSKKHIKNERNIDWLGGVGNHKDVFLPLYSNLLGLYIFSCCCLCREGLKLEEQEQLSLDVVELGESLSPLLKNPLIQNLYSLVVKIHKEKVGVDIATLDGFDPYFLLR